MMLKERYQVERSIGKALYGNVYVCQDKMESNRKVAIKQIDLAKATKVLSTNHEKDNPFNEGLTIYKLSGVNAVNDHVLKFHAGFVDETSYYIVMEYCEGGDMLELLQRYPQHRLPEPLVAHYFGQIVQGVQFLHANNIAHRDLSLENILLDSVLGACKICDFGLSTPANRVCEDVVGKPYYIAPEVVCGAVYDPTAADVWSLGIMLFIMLTGSPLAPLASSDEKAFLAFRKYGIQTILSSWRMDDLLSEEMMHLLDGLLQISPLKRLTIEEILLHPALDCRPECAL